MKKPPNKAPEPTSGTVMPPAEPGVMPFPPVAHLERSAKLPVRLNYRSSIEDRLSFEQTFAAEFESRAVPQWLGAGVGLVFAGGLYAMAYFIAPRSSLALPIVGLFGAFTFLCVQAYSLLRRRYMRKFLLAQGDTDAFSTAVEGAFLTFENRGMKVSCSLPALTRTYGDGAHVYFEFGDLRRARIPVHAFDSAQHREEFLALIDRGSKQPNKAPEPTTMAHLERWAKK